MSAPRGIPTVDAAGSPEHPKNLGFMAGWLVFLGIYQIFLAWRFGTFFEGTQGLLRAKYGVSGVWPLYVAIGIVALIEAWGLWNLRRWAYHLGFVLQGLVYALVLIVIGLWIDGKPAPVGWLVLDAAFGAYNIWWATRPETRAAFLGAA